MVTKTYLPFNLFDSSGNSDSNNYCASSDSSDSSTNKLFKPIFSSSFFCVFFKQIYDKNKN